MSRSRNTYPHSQKMFSSSRLHKNVALDRIARLGAPTVSTARRVQATEAHLDDTVRAEDGGRVYSCDCCGPTADFSPEAHAGAFDCPGCGLRCWQWMTDRAPYLETFVVATGELHDFEGCMERQEQQAS